MPARRFYLNTSKTRLICFGSKQHLIKLDHKLIASLSPNFPFSSSVRDLGVTLDSVLTFKLTEHIPTDLFLLLLTEASSIRWRIGASTVFTTMVHAFFVQTSIIVTRC